MGRTGKYTEEFKKKVAKDRVENSLSVKETAKKYGISNGTVCIWTDMFYDPSEYSSYLALKCSKEIKAQVVAEYLAGKGKMQIAREYGICKDTVEKWVDQHWKREEKRRLREKPEKEVFRRPEKIVNGRRLKTVYPTSGSAYVTWDK
ncbi:transposase [Anaerostipes caccae]|uniref:transposase n=1 Tax=Anaerostipes caccae TaxID=105841 RepID=UPI001CD478AC|nr:transposase [Anaerostipes caccae]UBS43158.1 transposase [Anaerostipes caccae]